MGFKTSTESRMRHIFFFVSSDGINWNAQQSILVMQANTAPALALFGGGNGLSCAYISNNTFYSAWGANI